MRRLRTMKIHPMPRVPSTRPARPLAPFRVWLARGAATLVVLAAYAGAQTAPGNVQAERSAEVVAIPVTGAIGPASADFITRSLARAASEHAQLAVIELDTPGGLDTSMRQIIKAILASPLPVAAFVAPSGARAASAGTYIVYACHFAAMAPGTNLGAATPIQIGAPGAGSPEPKSPGEPGKAASSAPATQTQSTETRKQIDDAAAYIRGLAQLRGRNAQWAERAVREAVSLSANEALEQHVVDMTARDLPDLLTKLDGRKIETATGTHTLATAHARVVTLEPDWRSHVLAVITDPNVALILLTIGMYGLFFEFASPGFVLPGVAGAICLLVGLFALQLLPISYTGLALIFLGIAFLIAEAFLPSFGTLGFGGIVAFAAGALMLIDTDAPGYGVPLTTIAAISVAGAAFVFFVSSFAYRARRRPVVTGSEAMLGSIGEIIDAALLPVDGQVGSLSAGWARVRGERWRVTAATPLAAGARVRVVARHGLILDVEPIEEPQKGVSP